ncbi:MAG: transcriptional repressor [Verrucomicrobiota bacterium]|nr:transcriptional repressor [Limisphaera sp.]MDW8382497.1 transcriptional repressor [Verrucomicrobiota bacterium]
MSKVADRLGLALETCARLRIRLTPVRRAVLEFLARQDRPIALANLLAADTLRGRWNSSTVYRTVMLLQAARVIRSVGMPPRTSFCMLNLWQEPQVFLICRCCGAIQPVSAEPVLTEALQDQINRAGFGAGPFDVALHGLCALCASAQEQAVCPCKLAAVQPRRRRLTSKPDDRASNHQLCFPASARAAKSDHAPGVPTARSSGNRL